MTKLGDLTVPIWQHIFVNGHRFVPVAESVVQDCGSVDPDAEKNIYGPPHWILTVSLFCNRTRCCEGRRRDSVTLRPERWESTAKSLLGKTTLLSFSFSNLCLRTKDYSCCVGTGYQSCKNLLVFRMYRRPPPVRNCFLFCVLHVYFSNLLFYFSPAFFAFCVELTHAARHLCFLWKGGIFSSALSHSGNWF